MSKFSYTSTNTKSTTSDWIGKNQGNVFSKSSNPIEDANRQKKHIPFYHTAEPGISHPATTSTVKLRNNGMIDIFVSTDQGIRIDPKNKTINIMTNSEKHHIGDLHIWATGLIQQNSRKDHTINTDSSMNINARKNWNVNVDGNANINAKGEISITSGKNIRMKAAGNMYFNANRYFYD